MSELSIQNFISVSCCKHLKKDTKMNITCEDGKICIENDNYREQCEVFSGPDCNYPCDATNCEVTVELDTMCREFFCFSPAPPSPPGPHPNIALAVCLPLGFLMVIGFLLLYFIRKWKRSTRIAGEFVI